MLSEMRARREARERAARAADSLRALRSDLEDAYGRFNRTADPALLEASILEIGALNARYDAALREAKALPSGGSAYDYRCYSAARRRGRAHRAAAAAAEKADEVGA